MFMFCSFNNNCHNHVTFEGVWNKLCNLVFAINKRLAKTYSDSQKLRCICELCLEKKRPWVTGDFVFLSGGETGVGASRKDAIPRRRLLHGKAGRRGELPSRYRLPRQGDCRPRASSFSRYRYHSRRRRVSPCVLERLFLSLFFLFFFFFIIISTLSRSEKHYNLATFCNILAAISAS